MKRHLSVLFQLLKKIYMFVVVVPLKYQVEDLKIVTLQKNQLSIKSMLK